MGISSIVVICSACFGGLMSVATIIHQLLFSRNQEINAAIQKRALEQQQQSLAAIRTEMREQRQPINTMLYEDSKAALAAIEQKMSEINAHKVAFLEKHLEWLGECFDDNKEEQASPDSVKSLHNDLHTQLSQWDQQLNDLASEKDKWFQNHFDLSKQIQSVESDRMNQLNKLYDAHGQMLEDLQKLFTEEHISLAEIFINSSIKLFETTVLAPAKFLMGYFQGGQNQAEAKSADKSKEEANSREDTKTAEKLLNAVEGTLTASLTA